MDERVTITPTPDAAGLAARYQMALQAIVALNENPSAVAIAKRALDVQVQVTIVRPDLRRGGI